MEPTKDALSNLKKLHGELLIQKEDIEKNLIQVEGAIFALEGSPRKKVINKDHVDFLNKEGYNTKWTNADKLTFLLYKYGPLTVREMLEKAKIHEGKGFDEKKLFDRFTYQSNTMKRAGLINSRTVGQRNIYSLKPL